MYTILVSLLPTESDVTGKKNLKKNLQKNLEENLKNLEENLKKNLKKTWKTKTLATSPNVPEKVPEKKENKKRNGNDTKKLKKFIYIISQNTYQLNYLHTQSIYTNIIQSILYTIYLHNVNYSNVNSINSIHNYYLFNYLHKLQFNYTNSQSNYQSNESETYTLAQDRKSATEKENNISTVHKILSKNVTIYSQYNFNITLSLFTKKGNAYELLPLARKTTENYVDKLKLSCLLDKKGNASELLPLARLEIANYVNKSSCSLDCVKNLTLDITSSSSKLKTLKSVTLKNLEKHKHGKRQPRVELQQCLDPQRLRCLPVAHVHLLDELQANNLLRLSRSPYRSQHLFSAPQVTMTVRQDMKYNRALYSPLVQGQNTTIGSIRSGLVALRYPPSKFIVALTIAYEIQNNHPPPSSPRFLRP